MAALQQNIPIRISCCGANVSTMVFSHTIVIFPETKQSKFSPCTEWNINKLNQSSNQVANIVHSHPTRDQNLPRKRHRSLATTVFSSSLQLGPSHSFVFLFCLRCPPIVHKCGEVTNRAKFVFLTTTCLHPVLAPRVPSHSGRVFNVKQNVIFPKRMVENTLLENHGQINNNQQIYVDWCIAMTDSLIL